jgi:hypothetical protein
MHAHPDHTTGLSIVTLGTGTRSNAVWEGIEILASHNYAVIGSFVISTACTNSLTCLPLDITENEGIRTLTVLDTWVKPGQEGQRKQPGKLAI